jgi:hypothetical protein
MILFFVEVIMDIRKIGFMNLDLTGLI